MSIVCRLGFGLTGIAGLASHKEQDRLLGTALDCGVTHFDVAPSYGSGDAEHILGVFLQGRRDRLTIATKVSPFAHLRRPGLKLLRQAARKFFKAVPGLKRRATVAWAGSPADLDFSPKLVRTSVDRSLGELGVDRIDVLLLHDWPATAALDEEVIAELAALSKAGKIDVAGLASSTDAVIETILAGAPIHHVFQFENSLLRPAGKVMGLTKERYVITHRALSGTLRSLTKLLRTRPGLRALWQRTLGIDPADEIILARLLLEWALANNPQGSVLFSTTRPERVKANAQLLESTQSTAEERSGLEALIADVHSTAAAMAL